MRRFGVRTKVFGGVFAFCAIAFAPIDRADAGCGDYLTMDHGKSISAEHGSAPMKPGTSPCNGPSCHRHDGPPLVPSPELRTASPTFKMATILADDSAEQQRISWRSAETDLRPRSGCPSSILRPPRSV